jgi:hypothetical protein
MLQVGPARNPVLLVTNASSPKRERLKVRVFGLTAIFFMVASTFGAFRIGVERGFDHVIPPSQWGRFQSAIAAAITDIADGKRGYIAYDNIQTVLAFAGLTGDVNALASIGAKYPDNLHDAGLIDSAIEKAVRFEHPVSKLLSLPADDLGFVDYVQIAFALLGFKLRSLYLLYFILFAASAGAMLITFRAVPGVLAILSVVAAIQTAFFASPIFSDHIPIIHHVDHVSIINPKTLTVLAIIPGLHIALAILLGSSPSPMNIALICVQASVIAFVWSIRGSTIWVPFGICLLSIGIAFGIRWRGGSWGEALRRIWPTAGLIVVCTLHSVYIATTMDPIYQKIGDLGNHETWHPIYYSLQLHPQWAAKYGPMYGNAVGDEQPKAAVKNYMLRHPPTPDEAKSLFRDDYGSLKSTVYEMYLRKAFFEFIKDDPRFAFETFFIYKPLALFRYYCEYGFRMFGRELVWLIVIFGPIGIAIALVMASDARVQKEFLQAAAIASGGFLISTIPFLIAYPVIADDFFALMITLTTWALLITSIAIRWVWQFVPSRHAL